MGPLISGKIQVGENIISFGQKYVLPGSLTARP